MLQRLLSLLFIILCAASASHQLMAEGNAPKGCAFYIAVFDTSKKDQGSAIKAGMNLEGVKVLSSPTTAPQQVMIAEYSTLSQSQLFFRVGGRILTVIAPNLCLDTKGGNVGTDLIVYTYNLNNNQANQQFECSSDGYLICKCENNNRAAYIKENKVFLDVKKEKPAHTFVQIPVLIYLYNAETKRYITSGDSKANAEPWTTAYGSPDDSKLFFLVPDRNTAGYFYIVPKKYMGKCLDIRGSVDTGNDIVTWNIGTPSVQKNQIFHFEASSGFIVNALNAKGEKRVISVDSSNGNLRFGVPGKGLEKYEKWNVFPADHPGPAPPPVKRAEEVKQSPTIKRLPCEDGLYAAPAA
ncbi:hypothetical protein DI09_41p90 [Mitosporidium daphniae]|uniref:Ricin B lectin domain-containing protein n=1 Tax=Mitosporidium daphniae TaxID=1485682 RepID=A0A098VQ62_9MICR|nr:uncharacterized protein DI09_41p90 [Mitosporidium daphniae]KGG51197.1 hypothetical protein DI09_41p90 [Mitosporidium daphniae]|eukprot:XP_013237646.1 uncharacterized protein DI09_41p90 [Mitosporidium daphniae]